eukprot:scaffold7935_cov417-Prasinococcus_capsulatus_cf.AAC.5
MDVRSALGKGARRARARLAGAPAGARSAALELGFPSTACVRLRSRAAALTFGFCGCSRPTSLV